MKNRKPNKHPKNSAIGEASHTPVISKILGKINKHPAINRNVRPNAINAEIRPFDKAVNIPLKYIPNPHVKSANEKIWFPYTARLYTGVPGLTKKAIKCFPNVNDKIVEITDITKMNIRLILFNFFNLTWSEFPW